MSESTDERSFDPGLVQRGRTRRQMAAVEILAVALAVLWAAAAIIYLLLNGSRGTAQSAVTGLMGLLVVVVPVVLIGVTAATLRLVQDLRAQAARLHAAVEAMRKSYVIQQQQSAAQSAPPTLERKIDELVTAQRQTSQAIITFTSRRDAPDTVPSADRSAVHLRAAPDDGRNEEPALALGAPADASAPPLDNVDLIRALNFPENAEDKEGFRALRAGLEERNTAKLIRAAQDVLTLLAQDGVYMDDLEPDRARPELWRKFAEGERGGSIAGLGGIRDRSCLALTTSRMRSDPVFRDAAHHFMRHFDHRFAEFAPDASDAEIVELAQTRSARAFMLLGRVTGTFD